MSSEGTELTRLMSRRGLLDGTTTWVCPRCGFHNKDPTSELWEYDEDEQRVPVTPVCKLCAYYDSLLVLAGLAADSDAPEGLRSAGSAASDSKAGGRDDDDEDAAAMPVAAHIVMSFRLCEFGVRLRGRALMERIRAERQMASEFKQLFAKVILLLDNRYTSVRDASSGLWDGKTARRPLKRREVSQLVMGINAAVGASVLDKLASGVVSDLSRLGGQLVRVDDDDSEAEVDDSRTDDVLASLDPEFARLPSVLEVECRRLSALFFSRPLAGVVSTLEARIGYFDTLFMNIEVGTSSGEADQSIDLAEFYEGLSMLGVPSSLLEVPLRHFVEAAKAMGVEALELSQFRMLCLQLSSPVAVKAFDNMKDLVSAVRKSDKERGRAKERQRRRASMLASARANAHGGDDWETGTAVSGVADDRTPLDAGGAGGSGARGQRAPPPPPAPPFATGVQLGMVREASVEGDSVVGRDRGGSAGSAGGMDTGAAKVVGLSDKGMVHVPRTDRVDLHTAEVGDEFVLEFRQRLQFLYESAEGAGFHVAWDSFFATFSQFFFFPLTHLMWLMKRWRDAIAEFNLYNLIFYALGVGYWACVFAVPVRAMMSSNGCACTTQFEEVYPIVTFVLGGVALGFYNGYYAVPLHPSTLRYLRLKFRVQNMSCRWKSFAKGRDETVNLMRLMVREGLVPAEEKEEGGLALVMSTLSRGYLQSFTKTTRTVLLTTLVFSSLFLALFPGTLRVLQNGVFQTGYCRGFWGNETTSVWVPDVTVEGGAEAQLANASGHWVTTDTQDVAVAATYVPLAFLQTFVICGIMVRLYVQYAEITRYVQKFTAMSNPITARRKRPGALLKFGDSDGRLSGYLDLKYPQNVRAWSKMRFFMLQKFSDELSRTQIFLGFALVLMLVALVLLVMFLVVPQGTLQEAGLENATDPNAVWKWQLMGFLTIIVVILIGAPMFIVLTYGVAINTILASHLPMLAKIKYEVHEMLAMRRFNGEKEREDLREAHTLIGDLAHILQQSDMHVKVLGVALTDAMVKTVFSSGAVAGVSSMVKVFAKKTA